MTKQETIEIVERNREMLQIDPEMVYESAERAIVEYKEDREIPGLVEDRIAWIVTLSCRLGFVEVQIDDKTGSILWVRRSA